MGIFTTQKNEVFYSECDQILQYTLDLVAYTEEILNGKLHFLCNDFA